MSLPPTSRDSGFVQSLVAMLEKMPPFSVVIKVFVILIVAARQSVLTLAGVAL